MTSSLKKSVQQTERLTTDLEGLGQKNAELRDRVSKLEGALEKVN